jgi:hypothetical protein
MSPYRLLPELFASSFLYCRRRVPSNTDQHGSRMLTESTRDATRLKYRQCAS